MRIVLIAVVLPFLSSGCAPRVSQIPPQWAFDPENLAIPAQSLRFDRADAGRYAVSGITNGDPGSLYRWTGREARMRFWLKPGTFPHVLALFFLDGTNFSRSKTATIDLRISKTVLKEASYSEPGTYRLEANIPSSAISPNQPAIVTLSIDPALTTPDGTILGVLLKSVTVTY